MEFNKQSFFVHHVEWFELYNPWLSAPNWSLSDQTYDKLYRFPCGECARQLQTAGSTTSTRSDYDILFTITVFGSLYFISSLLYMKESPLPQNKPTLLGFEDTTNLKHQFRRFLYKDQNHSIGGKRNEDNYSPDGTFFT